MMFRTLLACALLWASSAQAQMNSFFPGPGTAHAVSVPTTTWNPADKDASVTLSGGDLIATGGYGSVRSVASHSTGKYFFSTSINPISGGNAVGIANSSFVLSGSATGSLDSVGWFAEGGVIYVNNNVIGAGFTGAASNDILDVAVDLGAELMWVRVNGGDWNGSPSNNPATGVGGVDFSSANSGPWFAVISLNSSRVSTTNFGATAYSFAAPSGFGNW